VSGSDQAVTQICVDMARAYPRCVKQGVVTTYRAKIPGQELEDICVGAWTSEVTGGAYVEVPTETAENIRCLPTNKGTFPPEKCQLGEMSPCLSRPTVDIGHWTVESGQMRLASVG